MTILGLHGWREMEHDPAACLVVDGKLIAMAEEERFVRRKHAFDCLPTNATAYCLSQANILLDDVDLVTYGLNYKKASHLCGVVAKLDCEKFLDMLLPRKSFKYNKTPKIQFIDHHMAHAASAYHTSGFKDAAVLVIDGQGENVSTSLGYGRNGQISFFKQFPVYDSIGYLYEAVCQYIGFSVHDAGKIMGLAAYGDRDRYSFNSIALDHCGYSMGIKKYLNIDNQTTSDWQRTIIYGWKKYFSSELKWQYIPSLYSYKQNHAILGRDEVIPSRFQKDVAASLQKTVERLIIHLCAVLRKKTRSKNLVISGGVALNCSVNGKIADSSIFENIHIFPAANDAGVAVGSALYAYHQKSGAVGEKIDNIYLGPAFTDEQIKRLLCRSKIKYELVKDIEKETAKLLSEGCVVGWFQGRMEAGPRALGDRSILADPRKKENHEKVNRIKGRENWRPLSPSILYGYEGSYFENAKPSPFMLKSVKVRSDKLEKIPAVVHVDGTARPQSVSQKANLRYYNLLSEFNKITKVPLLLNTSMNGPGEPIVCSPMDAVRLFYSTGLDCLVMNNYIIKKEYEKK